MRINKRDNIERLLRQMKEFTKKTCKDQESARKFLMSTGAYDASGQLKPEYR